MWVFALVYVVGVFASIFVCMNRAGMDWMHGAPASQILSSPEWFAITMGKSLFWPVNLIIWNVQGQAAFAVGCLEKEPPGACGADPDQPTRAGLNG